MPCLANMSWKAVYPAASVAAANFTQHSTLLEDFTITKHIPTVTIPYQNGSCKDKDKIKDVKNTTSDDME